MIVVFQLYSNLWGVLGAIMQKSQSMQFLIN